MGRVLIGCERSGVVRRAFAARGHDAWSCDLLPAADGSNKHLIGDVRDFLHLEWDLLAVFHPPCTRLCNSGVRWLHEPPKGRTLEDVWTELEEAAALFGDLWNAGVPRVCVENPIMHGHAKARIKNYRPPVQTVQPWWFGDPAFKGTSLYLRGLDPLRPTKVLPKPEVGSEEWKRWSAVHRAPPGPRRWYHRAKTYPGVANAMADQWGRTLPRSKLELMEL